MNQVDVIAEVGSVHDGSLGNAHCLIDVAADCGADVVKFQTHLAECETLPDAPMPPYFKGEPRFEYFLRTGFSREQWIELKEHCRQREIEFLSSPFSNEAVDLLEDVGVRRYKIGSGEMTNLPLLHHVAATGKPIILSSGMSSWQELDAAMEAIGKHHNQIVLLQCTSEYPCPAANVGLDVMQQMRDRYQVPVGLSDHTLDLFAPIAAVALGADVIEKHLTFSRKMYGSDARHSMEPGPFSEMVRGIREVTVMRQSSVDKDANAARLDEMKQIFEKSVVSIAAIEKDTQITPEMITVKKPGTGIPARRLPEIVGMYATCRIPADTLLTEEMLRA
ncbi:MAG: N-acetylneuraminate synthase family protein [Pirellulales bacterium]|nr:N-acetylneuraminate synthase family protein [Pirellulales bacterium]